MVEYNITKTDFDKQKNELKTFADQPATSTRLDTFSTVGKLSDFLSGGLLGMTTHKVTGAEMNELVAELQTCFMEINERERKVIKEFGQVYETFEALEKGYIQGIVIGLKSAEKASQEAKDAQKDVNDAIKTLQITIAKLKSFKDEIKGYKHLKDIDQVWDDLNSVWIDIRNAVENIENVSSKVEETSVTFENKYNSLESFKVRLEEQIHLRDIDKIWDKTVGFQSSLESMSKAFNENQEDLEKSIQRIDDAIKSQVHFKDIDILWDILENTKQLIKEEYKNTSKKIDGITAYLDELKILAYLKKTDETWDYSHKIGENVERILQSNREVEERLVKTENTLRISEMTNQKLNNKVRKLYWLAGGTLLLSLIQMLLIMTGVF